jgi:hypothetical protein
VVGLIANTSTQTGLKVRAATDQKPYRTGIKVSDAEMKQLSLVRDEFHGDWNYEVRVLDRDSTLAATTTG